MHFSRVEETRRPVVRIIKLQLTYLTPHDHINTTGSQISIEGRENVQ